MSRFITGLFGTKQKSAPATALRISSSLQGQVIPLMLSGRQRMAINLIDYFNFQAQSGSSSGGKGGTTGKGSGAQTTYTVSFIGAICEGPIQAVTLNWINGSVLAFNGTQTIVVIGGSTNVGGEEDIYLGDYSQTGWPISESFFGTIDLQQLTFLQLVELSEGIIPPGFNTQVQQNVRSLAYRGIAYVASPNYMLGSSPTLPQINLEVQSGNSYNVVPGQPDGDAPSAAYQFLANPYYGLGFPTFRLADWADYPNSWRNYCTSLGLGVSVSLASAVQASAFLTDLIEATNSAACWQNGQLNIVPYGDAPISQGQLSEIGETHIVGDPNAGLPGGSIVYFVSAITVGNVGTFVADLGVNYTGGSGLTLVGYPPFQAGTYAQAGGTYYFYQTDFGQTVTINYEYAAAASYVPDTEVLYDFTTDDFLPNQGTIGTGLAGGSSPIVVVRKPRDQMANNIKVEYLDRNNSYNPVNIEVKDSASMTVFGRVRPSEVKQYHFFALASAAVQSASLRLVREQISRTFQWTCGKHFMMILQLMKVVTLTESNMGMFRQAVRIIEIQENTDETMTVTAEEFNGTASAPIYGTEVTSSAPLNYNAEPGPVNTPIIFEPTDELSRALISGGGLMIAAAISGTNPPMWGGAQVWVSYDGQQYTQVGTMTRQSRMGVLETDLAAYPINQTGAQTIDAINTVHVDVTESDGTLIGVSQTEAVNLNTRCFIGPPLGGTGTGVGEIISYQNAVLTETGHYLLSYLVRGAYGTEANVHAWPTGTAFARIDGHIFTMPFDKSRIGATLFFKFVSFNIYSGGLESLVDAPVYHYTIQGIALSSPLPDVQNLRTVFVGARLALTWDEVDDFRSGIEYEIRMGPSFGSALNLGLLAHPPFTIPSSNGTFWISAWAQPAANLIVRSEFPVSIEVANAILTTNLVATFDGKASNWPGVLTNAYIDADTVRLAAGSLFPRTDIVFPTHTATAPTPSGGTMLHLNNVTNIQLGMEAFNTNDAGSLQDGTTVIGIDPIGLTVTINPSVPSDWSSDFNVSDFGEFQNRGVLAGDTITFYPATITGSYAPAFTVDVGRVINTAITISYLGTGEPVDQNILTEANILTDQDILGAESTQFVDIEPIVLVSQDGVNYVPQKYAPGDYLGRSFMFQFNLTSVDFRTSAVLLTAVITVQLPTRIDHLLTNATLPAAGTTFVFTPDGSTTPAAFNGGPNNATVPQIIATWGDEQAGDVLSITGLSKTQATVQILNGGVGVQRNQVSLYAEGF